MSRSGSSQPTPLPVAEISVITSSLETLAARIESIGDLQRGTDHGDQISNELQQISSTIGQAHRRLERLMKR